ncbi:class I SAM-dependent methyltransferase [Rhodovibrionaceae bacterium A322]
MVARVDRAHPKSLLDIGCGEGRFCRLLSGKGIERTGIDPVHPFIDLAAQKDPTGRYLTGFAETLPFAEESFDMVVFYLTLIDIDDLDRAFKEAARVLKPGGRILIANLSSFSTSNGTTDWITGSDGRSHYPLGDYLTEQKQWFEWDGLRVQNWHRPLSRYLGDLLSNGLTMTFFDEPQPVGCTTAQLEKYRANPFVMMMEWQKPLTSG